jgi:hypothetical protein
MRSGSCGCTKEDHRARAPPAQAHSRDTPSAEVTNRDPEPARCRGLKAVGNTNSCGAVLVDEAAQHVPPANVRSHQVHGPPPLVRDGRLQPEPAMGPRPVVVSDVGPRDALEVSSAEDEGPVQALGPEGPYPSLA